ncbi:MAG TPA: hypothetical protein VNK41_09485 [Vicinamibacterales bacterium]|nr:hypothetical protein [Vicinamibacterales bacterium]
MRVLVLAHHARYACRRSGACCTAGWRIPVEPDRAMAIRRDFGRRQVFEEGTSILRLAPDGRCILYEPPLAGRPGACLVHRTRGHAALPSACRHFPRVFLCDGHATRLTLSHFCPTAASLLFGDDPLRIVDAPPLLAPPGDREGLDATTALPPLLHPDMLMDAVGYAEWETGAIGAFADACTPEDALARIDASVERLRRWRPGSKPLLDAVREVWGEVNAESIQAGPPQGDRAAWLANAAFESVPESLAVDASPLDEQADDRFAAERWPAFSAPIRRYLAGRLFGSWTAYQGKGLRTVAASAACALALLRIHAARACAQAARPLDAELLTGAVRQTDLLLVHKADAQKLADRLSRVERD